MNDKTKQAMTMALEALEALDLYEHEVGPEIIALREALYEPKSDNRMMEMPEALTQPQGKWVDLTDDETSELVTEFNMDLKKEARWLIDEVINKFKSKNTPPVVPQGEPVGWVDKGLLATKPDGWLQTISQIKMCSDDVPLYTTPPSVEAMRIETLEKAAQVCEELGTEPIDWMPSQLGIRPGHAQCAAAIRSMK